MSSQKRKPGFCIFPGYKWCGPGCQGPGAPINDVDACCQKHDKCLKSGKSPCECDREFLKCTHSKIDPNTDKGRKAALMYNYMKLQTLFTCGFDKRRSN